MHLLLFWYLVLNSIHCQAKSKSQVQEEISKQIFEIYFNAKIGSPSKWYEEYIVTTGPLEWSNCRVHLRGRCRDLLTDAFINAGVAHASCRRRQPFRNTAGLYPDSQSLEQKERNTKENNLLFLEQVKKWPFAVKSSQVKILVSTLIQFS
jgi:hypothetical protein